MTQPPSIPPSPSPAAAADTGAKSFRYEAQTINGEPLSGTLEAANAAEANEQLVALQLRVLAVEPAPVTGRPRSRLGPDDFLIFNQQLAHLTSAGLPIEHGLRLIAGDLNSGKLSDAARSVAEELERGVPLDQAFQRHARRFPSLYGKLIDAGAKSGNLPGMLFNLGHHMELVSRLRQTIWRTLSYPIMVLVALLAVMLFLSLTVLPKFVPIFEDFRTTLPLLTVVVMKLSSALPVILIVVGCVIAAGLIYGAYLRATGRAGVIADRLLIGVPVIGPVLRASLLARWIDALRLGIDAGLDLPHAVDLAGEATASQRLEEEGKQLVDTLVSGRPANLFPGRLIPQTVPAAIELSARAGDLQLTLATLTRLYREQAEQRIRLVPAVFTPLALLIIAGSVGTIVAAYFLPLVKLIQSVSSGDM